MREKTACEMTLNYGHTFGHALESITNYNAYRHGEAVAIGMSCAAQLACNLGMLPLSDLERSKAVNPTYGTSHEFSHQEYNRTRFLMLCTLTRKRKVEN